MRFPSLNPLLLISTLATAVLPASAENILRSSSLAACQENSGFTASLFDVVFTPDNATAAINMIATSSIEGHVLFDIIVLAYGYQIIRTTVDPCKIGLGGMCPMTSGKMNYPFIIGNGQIPQSAINQIPGIAYTFPDLDATARIYINMTSGDLAGTTIACLEADISNGKTVDLIGVKWATAAVIAAALFSSAVVHGLGFTNAASHIAANSLALFSYFQAQAMLGLCSVPLPPVAMAWLQDFQWTMGIIRVGFMQTAITWYQRATGGTASIIFDTLHSVSVQIQKRSLPLLEPAADVVRRSVGDVAEHASNIAKRSYIMTSYGSYVVYGIQRVGFRARIETTNLFLTSLTFFYFLALFTVVGVVLFKLGCELFIKLKLVRGETFSEFRNGWLTSLKGILFRLTLICFPQLTVFCLWEFTPIARDSPGAVTLAVFFFFSSLATLCYAAYKVIRIARRSVALHRNPAYILFSDPRALNKWGFLYVQYRASAYYFIVPTIVYILVKGMFVALAQESGTVQAVALIIIEAAALITVSVLRPFMDKSTNSFNIAICAINFVNAIFLFIFTDVFGLPGLVIGVVGVVLWIANAAFALILLLMLIITTTILLFHNNPDTRYQFMNDDRTSFIKSQTHVATVSELDALAATARGPVKGLDLDDDESARSSPANLDHNGLPRPGTAGSNSSPNRYSLKSVRDSARNSVRMENYMTEKGHHLRNQHSGSIRAPSPFTASGSEGSLPATVPPPQTNHAKPQGASPWQRGAGYD